MARYSWHDVDTSNILIQHLVIEMSRDFTSSYHVSKTLFPDSVGLPSFRLKSFILPCGIKI
jgi:hypothetical protein